MVSIAVYRLGLGSGIREFVKDVYRLAAETPTTNISMLLLPVKPLRDLLVGKKNYGSYRKAIRALSNRIASVINSERAYAGPVAMRFGESSFLSVIDLVSGAEVSRKFIRFNGLFKGYLPKSPIVDVRGVRLCIAVLDDILYPEVARYCAESGSSTLVDFFIPIIDIDPELVALVARLRAYENRLNVIVVGGYSNEYSIPTVIVKKDGSVADMTDDKQPEVVEVQLPPETERRAPSEISRRYYAKAIKMINDLIRS